jgi:superfamily II DNA or RNA helicase
MKITCLWSRDAPSKKRKRWCDGSLTLVAAAAAGERGRAPGECWVNVRVMGQEGVAVGTVRMKERELQQHLKEGGEFRAGGVIVDVESMPCLPPELLTGGGNDSSAPLAASPTKSASAPTATASRIVAPFARQHATAVLPRKLIASTTASYGQKKFRLPAMAPSTAAAAGGTAGAPIASAPTISSKLSASKGALRQNRLVTPVRPAFQHPARVPSGTTKFVAPRVTSESINSAACGSTGKVREQTSFRTAATSIPSFPHQDLVGLRIAKHLKPHQQEGVAFLWNRLRPAGGGGAILADEMGLGKTLTSIATISACLRHLGPNGVRKVLVVCPSSLVKNWSNEISRWGGLDLSGRTIAATKAGLAGQQAACDFNIGSAQRFGILVISYELFRRHETYINSANGLGLLVCDEAHRLKGAGGSKTMAALQKCPATRRLLLTGTPIQNNLEELWCLSHFACPGILGPLREFRAHFADAIEVKDSISRSKASRALAATRSSELANKMGEFILRRSKSVAADCLPPMSEVVVFCRLDACQAQAYCDMLSRDSPDEGDEMNLLPLVGNLRKISNHPRLLAEGTDPAATSSVKLRLLQSLLRTIRSCTQDRVIISSGFTSMLDIIEELAAAEDWLALRLDGSTPADERQSLVDRFNRVHPVTAQTPDSPEVPFLFLLSAKAGGVGLNLVGANRLILYDSDWNPATDAQTMARVWRFGQEKPVTVYRLVTAGTIEENILQRQLLKEDLNKVVRGGATLGKVGSQFTREELKDLCSYSPDSRCKTFDKLCIRRPGLWSDYSGPEDVVDPPLSQVLLSDAGIEGCVTFVHTIHRSLYEEAAEAQGARPQGAGEEEAGGSSSEEGEDENDEGSEKLFLSSSSDSSSSDGDSSEEELSEQAPRRKPLTSREQRRSILASSSEEDSS